MNTTPLFDVYHGINYPHRILQNVTYEEMQAYCKKHGLTHQQHRDAQVGVRFWQAFVV